MEEELKITSNPYDWKWRCIKAGGRVKKRKIPVISRLIIMIIQTLLITMYPYMVNTHTGYWSIQDTFISSLSDIRIILLLVISALIINTYSEEVCIINTNP